MTILKVIFTIMAAEGGRENFTLVPPTNESPDPSWKYLKQK